MKEEAVTLSIMEDDGEAINPISVGSIDSKTFGKFRRQVAARLEKYPNAPLLLLIDSSGGEAYPMLGMIDYLNQIKQKKEIPVVTCCLGKAMSAGFVLLSCGDYRYCSPNSILLFHEVSIGMGGMTHLLDLQGEAREMERLENQVYSILAKNMKVKGGAKKARELLVPNSGEREIYITPERALEIGVIDEIGFPVIRATTTYTLT